MSSYSGRGRGGYHGPNVPRQLNSRFPEFTEEELAQPKPPLWAKGFAIGHFFRLKGLRKRASGEKTVKKGNCIPLEISESKIDHIANILSKISIDAPPAVSSVRKGSETKFQSDEEKYRHIGESAFKRNFLSSIGGSMLEKISKNVHTTEMNRNAVNDQFYMVQETDKVNNPRYQCMLEIRKKLPSFSKREEILDCVKSNNVILISGETGCGKTTQVPQFILEDSIKNGNGSLTHIICTQPRRISAISVAGRVAEERGERLGQSVGYQIRLEKTLPRESGSILFVTTGILLQIMRSDPLLTKISHVILDEIHERDTLSDFVITLLKDIVPARPDLKVLLMSATINAEHFSKYFNNCPIVHIPGFTFPVTEYYLEDVIEMLHFQYSRDYNHRTRKGKGFPADDLMGPFFRNLEGVYSRNTIDNLMKPESNDINNELIMSLIFDINLKQGPGAILIFLPGWERIKTLHREMSENYRMFPSNRFVIIPLHSLMPTVNQRTVFDRPPPGVRKIILATNIAETSITIDDVVFVIDCGKTKIKNFDIKNNVSTLREEWISVANAKQRKGRAGRVQPGICYHLYPSGRVHFFDMYQLPEILRTRLEEVILQAKILQLGKIAPFLNKVMDPPNPEAVQLSLELLISMNALDDDEKLTPLGFHLASLPIDPQAGKMILLASMFSCIDALFSIAASLSFKDAFYVPLGKEDQLNSLKHRIDSGLKSDHLIMAKVIYMWESEKKVGKAREFCQKNFLSYSVLEQLHEMKIQFSKLMHDMNYLSNSDLREPSSNVNSRNLPLLKALVCGALYPNVAVIKNCVRKGTKICSSIFLPENNQKVSLHVKCVNESYDSFESRFLIYYEKMKCLNTTFLFDTTMVFPMPLIFFCHKFNVEETGDLKIIEINSNIRFVCSKRLASLIFELRAWLDWLLEYKLSHPGVTNWSSDCSSDEFYVLSAITELITCEHEKYTNDDDDDDYDE